MKCYVVDKYNQRTECELDDYFTLTPKAAIAAVRIVYGPTTLANVIGMVDGRHRNYRVTGGIYTPRRARKVY